MEGYEGATMIKTFRGLIGDGLQDTIVLHTNDGSMGYRIVKFQVISQEPGGDNSEAVLKIYKVSQTSISTTVDFSDNTLLAVAFYRSHGSSSYPTDVVISFDNEIFNQDIYITLEDRENNKMNYYLELEQVKLDLNASTVATLKNLKNLEPGG